RFLIHGVDLSGKPQVSDSDLAQLAGLAKLETVNLDGTGVTGEGLSHLKSGRALRTVDLGGLQVSDESVASLKSALPGVEVKWNPNSERAAAEWVLGQRGSVSVATPDGEIVPDV